mmetsp:Transcript_17157/g.39741  ORF Transcript_17157/g.39741 Transcript_17157/m.39741 type:complete len:88 (-) Transcript_17157:869-1132(-)
MACEHNAANPSGTQRARSKDITMRENDDVMRLPTFYLDCHVFCDTPTTPKSKNIKRMTTMCRRRRAVVVLIVGICFFLQRSSGVDVL